MSLNILFLTHFSTLLQNSMVEAMYVLVSKILIGIDISLGLAITNIVSLDSQFVSIGIIQTMYMGILDTRLV